MPGPYTATRKNENMNIIEITDLSAPELAPYTRLTEAQLRNKLEPEKGIFIAESPKVIGTALDAGCEPLSFLMERRQIDGPAAGVLARCPRRRRLHRGPQCAAGPDRLRADPGCALRHCAVRSRAASRRCAEMPAASRCWRVSWIPPTSGPSSAGPPHWAWTRCCSRRPAAPALPPCCPRQHGHGVPGAVGNAG